MATWLDLHDSGYHFGMTADRASIPEGAFGFLAKWWCDHCGTACGEPEWRMTHRGTYWEPEDGYNACPSCGSDECGEHQDPKGMKVTNRYIITRRAA